MEERIIKTIKVRPLLNMNRLRHLRIARKGSTCITNKTFLGFLTITQDMILISRKIRMLQVRITILIIKDNTPEPTPFTIIQSFAVKLRYNQSKAETPIELNNPIHTNRQGLPAVLLEEDDYNIKLVGNANTL
ncbi:hypothetical protein H5410_013505 [Solanum commersonii]|uniref:Uncharacterized protein n=1 Tax=Solanum commersonii TaxID=4109 RepID=A0A9J5ZNE6_SOLCO|nr:hypothetical protein H5410_013505 [Solanum commersonii]